MRNHAFLGRIAALGLCFMAAAGVLLGPARPARAALTQRFATDDRANFVVFGNTTGLDCRDSITEKPLVGDVPLGPLGLFNCRGLLPDVTRGDDVLWRSDEPQNGRALASPLITPLSARSTAVLSLPAGAKVLYARLYWAAQRIPLLSFGSDVVVERPGTFRAPVNADRLRGSNGFGAFVSDTLMKLGLLGTIIGFIIMLAPIATLDAADKVAMKSSMGLMSDGMAVAMYTTLAGLIGSILVRIQYYMLDVATQRVFSDAVLLTETHVTPALERSLEGSLERGHAG